MAPEKPTETKPVNYSTEPCPDCGSKLVRPDVVHGDPIEVKTLDGKSLSEGDKVKVCDACGAIVSKVAAKKAGGSKKKSSSKRKRSASSKSKSTSSAKSKSTSSSKAKASSSKK